jgi:4-amino-4-deoxy-L-arabinose transferase-like glycosyltransferase
MAPLVSPSVATQASELEKSKRGVAPTLALIAFLGLATGLLFFARYHDFYSGDSYTYITPADNLVHGRGFTDAGGYPETLRTPGYPLLLVPFFWLNLSLKYLIVLQHLLRVAIAVATGVAAYQLTRSRTQAGIAGVVVCLDLAMLESANQVLTEIPFTATLCIVLWLLWRSRQDGIPWSWWVMAGFLGGGMTLIRPIGIFFAVPAVVYLFLVRKSHRLRATLSFVLAFSCLPLLWASRNYSRTGSFVVSPISAWDILAYRAAGVLAINDPGDFKENLEKRRVELVSEVCSQMPPAYASPCLPPTVPQADIPKKSAYYMRLGRQVVLEHPFAYIKLASRGAGLTMFSGNTTIISALTGVRHGSARLILLICGVSVLSLAAAGAWSYWGSNRSLFWLLFLTMVYFVGISSGAESYSRFRVPILPVYAVLVAGGASYWTRRLLQSSSRTKSGAGR